MCCGLDVLGYLCLFVCCLFRLVMLTMCFRLSCVFLIWCFDCLDVLCCLLGICFWLFIGLLIIAEVGVCFLLTFGGFVGESLILLVFSLLLFVGLFWLFKMVVCCLVMSFISDLPCLFVWVICYFGFLRVAFCWVLVFC